MTKSKFTELVNSYYNPEIEVAFVSSNLMSYNEIEETIYLVDKKNLQTELLYTRMWKPDMILPGLTRDIIFENQANKYQRWLDEILDKQNKSGDTRNGKAKSRNTSK